MSPPKIKVRGAGRAKGVPQGYVLGRVSPGNGDVELLRMPDLARMGVQSAHTPALLALIPAKTVLANPGPGAAIPAPLTISAILDFISPDQGSVLYRSVTAWVALPPSTDGKVLTTHGAGQDVTWTTPNTSPVVYDDGTVPAGNTVANTAAETQITSSYNFDPALRTIALYDVIRVTLRGVYSTDAAVAPNLTLKFYLNATVVGSTGAITLATAQTNKGWEAHLLLFVTQAGVAGTAEVQGSAQLNGWQGITNLAALALDTTLLQALKVKFTWSVADVDDTITVRQMLVEHMGGKYIPPPPPADIAYIAVGDFEAMYASVTSGALEFILPGSYLDESS